MESSDDMLERVEKTIEEHQFIKEESPVLLMVSGGSDSTALAYLAHELVEAGRIGSLAMLHVNHQLRGQDSDDDQTFVSQLAEALDIPLFICEIDIAREASKAGENIEAAARRERYLAANEALDSFCLHAASPLVDGRIFTAHTQDDRVENFYMRSIVGTGPGGFRSMLYRNGPVVRPLLDVNKDDLREYLRNREAAGKTVVCDSEGNLWREDATNAHTDRFRSFVRHEIVARAKERNPQLLDTLCRSMNLIADEDDMLDAQTRQLMEACVEWLVSAEVIGVDYGSGCTIAPEMAVEPVPLQRRVCMEVLQLILGAEARVETASINRVLAGFANGAPVSGYTNNIQGDLAISANKQGVRIEPMAAYRARRKRG